MTSAPLTLEGMTMTPPAPASQTLGSGPATRVLAGAALLVTGISLVIAAAFCMSGGLGLLAGAAVAIPALPGLTAGVIAVRLRSRRPTAALWVSVGAFLLAAAPLLFWAGYGLLS